MASLHHNFKTHKESWREALTRLIEFETDEDQREYWKHELKAFDEAYKDFSSDTSRFVWIG